MAGDSLVFSTITSLSFTANMIALACSAAFTTIRSKMTLIKVTSMFIESDAPWKYSKRKQKNIVTLIIFSSVLYFLNFGCMVLDNTSQVTNIYPDKTNIHKVKIASHTSAPTGKFQVPHFYQNLLLRWISHL